VQDDAEVAEDVDEKFHEESLRLEVNAGLEGPLFSSSFRPAPE
jgi:hypothetical protein